MRPHVTTPVGPTCINYGHPLAQGLTGLWLFSDAMNHPSNVAGGPVNLVNNTPSNVMAADSVPYSWTHNAFGRAMSITATNTNVTLTGAADYQSQVLIPTDRLTMLMVYRLSGGGSATHLLGVGAAGTDTAKVFLPFSDNKMYFDFGGATGNNRITSAVLTWDTSTIYKVACVAGNRGLAMYRNTVRVASSTVAVTRTSGGAFRLAQDSPGLEVNFFALLNAEWTPSHVMDWMAHPYAMVMTPRLPVMASTGSAAFLRHRPRRSDVAIHRASSW